MTATPYIWHDDITVNGAPYPTRHTVPEDVTAIEDCFDDLTDTQRQYLTAIHEAGHAIAVLTAHACIHHAKIKPLAELHNSTSLPGDISSSNVLACNFSDCQAFAVHLGAGERAEDRWLRQNNLWTPRRATGVELGACGDRNKFFANNPHFGFGTDHNDYRVVHDLADQLVTQHWDAITAVADALVSRLYLTGQQIADLAQMPNGTHSKTCTYTATA